MAENMAYLPNVNSPSVESSTQPYYYVYDYSGSNVSTAMLSDNYKIYGVLYNWPAAMNGASSSNSNPSGVQGVCPSGWHLPSDSEWKELELMLGMLQGEADADFEWRGSVEGNKIKESGLSHWLSPNFGTNESGFLGLPGGSRDERLFYGIGLGASYWSSTEYDNLNSWGRDLSNSQSDIYRGYYLKDNGFSVRCIKN